jgi:hypothetical protein
MDSKQNPKTGNEIVPSRFSDRRDVMRVPEQETRVMNMIALPPSDQIEKADRPMLADMHGIRDNSRVEQ